MKVLHIPNALNNYFFYEKRSSKFFEKVRNQRNGILSALSVTWHGTLGQVGRAGNTNALENN